SAQLLTRMFERQAEIPPERLRERIAAIVGQSERLGRLVEQLLDVSRLEAGRLSVDPSPTDLAPLVRGVVATAQSRTERHEIELDAPESLVAPVDPFRFEQVVQNLLDNAIKYSPNG